MELWSLDILTDSILDMLEKVKRLYDLQFSKDNSKTATAV